MTTVDTDGEIESLPQFAAEFCRHKEPVFVVHLGRVLTDHISLTSSILLHKYSILLHLVTV